MYVFLEKIIIKSLTILSKIIWEQIREGKIILNWMDRKYKYLLRLNTDVSWNLAWPPVRTHWSTNTAMSLPVTVNMAFTNRLVESNKWPQSPLPIFVLAALVAKESCLLKTCSNNSWPIRCSNILSTKWDFFRIICKREQRLSIYCILLLSLSILTGQTQYNSTCNFIVSVCMKMEIWLESLEVCN